jgi:hypothetical protein
MARSVGAYAPDATCLAADCDRRPVSRGYCDPHYKRFRRHGDPTVLKRIARYAADAQCKAEGCDRQPRANQLCSMHWMRQSTTGDLGGGASTKPRGVLCAVDGCPTRRAGVHGYCQKHINRLRKTGFTGPADVTPANRTCWWCDRPFSNPDGRHRYCGETCAAAMEAVRRAALLYKITAEAYRRMWRAQDGKCAICREPERSERNQMLCVDHDHVSGHVRGLLCSHCNRAIGLFRDDPAVLKRAAEYAARGRQITLFSA